MNSYPAPLGLFVRGMGGSASVSVARVKVFTLAGVPISNVEFLVGGGDFGGAGLLGQNVFSIGDVEYDLAKGAIRLIHEEGCKNVNLAYWVSRTSQPYSVMDIESTTPRSPHTTGTATINGVNIRVMFDTGAYTSVLSQRAAERAGVPTPSSDAPPADSAPDEPKDGAAYSRRGTAFAARRDFQRAIADLTQACELAPDEPNYFYERGIARRDSGQPVPALADFDQAIKIKFDHVPALAARAEMRLQNGEAVTAVEDLDAAGRAAAKEADVRFRLGLDYQHADLMTQSVAQYDLWIAAHGDDARLGAALANRCWAKALLGQDLKTALADCNSALDRIGKKNTGSAAMLLSRGVVRLRLGDYDKSIVDFDAALALRPDSAWSLYGRGIAKIRHSRAVEGQADLSAAAAVSPQIAEDFARRGITP